jgi:hypothetical protein
MEDVGILYGHWPILQQIVIVYANLVHFMAIWYTCPHFGMLHRDKPGNPAADSQMSHRRVLFFENYLQSQADLFETLMNVLETSLEIE